MDGSLAERLHTVRRPMDRRQRPLRPSSQTRRRARNPAEQEIVVRRTKPASGTKKRAHRATVPPTRQGTLRPPMEKFVIEGGVPLSGTIIPAGNKNGALPILAACLLTDDEVILRNVPRIGTWRR